MSVGWIADLLAVQWRALPSQPLKLKDASAWLLGVEQHPPMKQGGEGDDVEEPEASTVSPVDDLPPIRWQRPLALVCVPPCYSPLSISRLTNRFCSVFAPFNSRFTRRVPRGPCLSEWMALRRDRVLPVHQVSRHGLRQAIPILPLIKERFPAQCKPRESWKSAQCGERSRASKEVIDRQAALRGATMSIE